MNLHSQITIMTRNNLRTPFSAKAAPVAADWHENRRITVEFFQRKMTELKDKIKIALDESRMLVLGTQILLGFQFRSAFEPAFDQLPKSSQHLKLIGLMILLVAITLIMAPGSYHRIVRAGTDAEDVHQFGTTMMDVALIPFLLAFALELFTSMGRIIGTTGGLIAGAVVGLTCLSLWYGLGWLSRSIGRAHV